MRITDPVTVKALRELRPGQELADGACRGLRARAREKGIVWSLLAVDSDGRKKRIEIGRWPETGVVEARRMAEELRLAIRRERAPVGRMTLGDVLQLYEAEGPALKGVSWAKDGRKRILNVFGALLGERAGELAAAQLLRAADAHGSMASAGAAIRYLRPALRWAEKRAYVPGGVWSGLEGAHAPPRRDRVLSEQELAQVLRTLGNDGHDGAVRMMLYTACRREEVCAMRFEDIIEDVWYVPGELRKNGRPHVVPLTQQALRVVGAQGRISGQVFLGAKGKPLDNWDRWQKKFFDRSGTSGWHRHDLRRTAATLMGDHGVLPAIVEIVLGHAEPHSALAGVYNKSRYAKEHVEALRVLGDVLQGMEIRARRAH